MDREALVLISNLLNEVYNGVAFSDDEFATRLGADRSEGLQLMADIDGAFDSGEVDGTRSNE